MKHSALVVFSGGQDSSTCLAQALLHYPRVETIGFDYGQRNRVELQARDHVRDALLTRFPDWATRLGEDHHIDLSVLGQIIATAMTRDTAITTQASGLPNTFVPGRNLLFLTFAATVAYRRDLDVLITGVSETDFSGYPDCRDDTLKALQVAISLGMDRHIRIETPLMWLDKAAEWALAHAVGNQLDPTGGGDALVELIVEKSHTCYLGDRSHRHPWGWGCGDCPACRLRAHGWEQWQAQRTP